MDRFTAHMDRAWQLISDGDGMKALLAARQALNINAESPEVHNLLGCIYAMDGDFEEAISCYEKAMELDDGYVDPLLNAAELLIHAANRTDDAIMLCRKARELVGPGEELFEVTLLEIDALLTTGRAEEARAIMDGLSLSKKMSAIHAMLVGRALFETGDFDRSREFIDFSLAKDPLLADAWYCRGLLFREEGRRIDAVSAFLTVLDSDQQREDPLWLTQFSSFEQLLKQSISFLDVDVRQMIASAVLKVAPLPTKEQILQEIDPRQAVFVEGIDMEKRSFQRVWLFFKNLEHAGIIPVHAEENLAQVLTDEIRFSMRHF